MGSLNFQDLLKVSDQSSFEPVPEGTYQIKIMKAEAKIAKTSGKDMIVADMEVVAGPEKGKGFRNNFVVSPESPNAMWFFFKDLGTLGLNRAYFDANPDLTKVARDLEGRYATAKVKHRTWNNRIQNELEALTPPSAEFSNPEPSVSSDPTKTPPAAAPTPAPAPAPAPAPTPEAPAPAPAPAPVAEPAPAPAPAPQEAPQEPTAPPAGIPPASSVAPPPDAPF